MIDGEQERRGGDSGRLPVASGEPLLDESAEEQLLRHRPHDPRQQEDPPPFGGAAGTDSGWGRGTVEDFADLQTLATGNDNTG